MIVYGLMLLVVVACTAIARRTKAPAISAALLAIAFLAMVLVGGLRDRTVGTDSGSYVGFFDRITTLSDVGSVGSRLGEHGFWLLIWLIHFVSDEYVVFFTMVAGVCVFCYQRAIAAHSLLLEMSYFLFIASGIYFTFYNGTRQAVACAVYALAIRPMLEKDFKLYVILVVVAFFFHKTAIMLLPVYFLVNKATTLKANVATILVGGVAVAFYDRILEVAAVFDPRYEFSGAVGIGGGYVLMAYSLVMSGFFLAFRKAVKIHRQRYDQFLSMYLFGTMIGTVSGILSANPSGLNRYSFYFSVATLFLWPIVFQNIRSRFWKLSYAYVFVLGYLVFFVLTTNAWSDLVPYRLNPSLFAH